MKNANDTFKAGFVTLLAKTKKRTGPDGLINRGLLVKNDQEEERWISMTDASITELELGTRLYFHGQGERPSLSIPQEKQIKPSINEELLETNCMVLSQAFALMKELNPVLSEEALVKLAISASIAYHNQNH